MVEHVGRHPALLAASQTGELHTPVALPGARFAHAAAVKPVAYCRLLLVAVGGADHEFAVVVAHIQPLQDGEQGWRPIWCGPIADASALRLDGGIGPATNDACDGPTKRFCVGRHQGYCLRSQFLEIAAMAHVKDASAITQRHPDPTCRAMHALICEHACAVGGTAFGCVQASKQV